MCFKSLQSELVLGAPYIFEVLENLPKKSLWLCSFALMTAALQNATFKGTIISYYRIIH